MLNGQVPKKDLKQLDLEIRKLLNETIKGSLLPMNFTIQIGKMAVHQ
jgi:hypothetical protein